MTATTRTYRVTAVTNGDGTSTIQTKQRQIEFDSSPSQGDELPGPADLLTAAFSACVLKNVERFGDTLRFQWRTATIEVEAERQDAPPKIIAVRYRLEIETDEPSHRVELLHRNITKFGTIYNTLAASCEVSGDLIARPLEVLPSDGKAHRQSLAVASSQHEADDQAFIDALAEPE